MSKLEKLKKINEGSFKNMKNAVQEKINQIELPVGYYDDLHFDSTLNFQFNRFHSLGYLPIEDLKEIIKKIKDFGDVTPEMVDAAEKAVEKKEFIKAVFYYRIAESCFFESEHRKKELYNIFIELFYEIFGNMVEKFFIPYESGYLKALKISPINEKKGLIVMHGGGDSYIEDFISGAFYVVQKGYEIIMFEGPGQGEAMQEHNITMTHEWEKPVKAVLDYFQLNHVILVGISLGGYFALRAAAFEHRIEKVILCDVVYDFFECMFGRNGKARYILLKFLLKLKASKFMNYIFKKQMEKDAFMKWLFNHSMKVHGVYSPYELLSNIKKYTAAPISHLVKQDVLVLAGKDDQYIPFKMYDKQLNALTNARSVTGRVFTREEEASNHSQVGNIKLVMDVIVNWIEHFNKS